MLDVLK